MRETGVFVAGFTDWPRVSFASVVPQHVVNCWGLGGVLLNLR